jgi:hypothetical protein
MSRLSSTTQSFVPSKGTVNKRRKLWFTVVKNGKAVPKKTTVTPPVLKGVVLFIDDKPLKFTKHRLTDDEFELYKKLRDFGVVRKNSEYCHWSKKDFIIYGDLWNRGLIFKPDMLLGMEFNDEITKSHKKHDRKSLESLVKMWFDRRFHERMCTDSIISIIRHNYRNMSLSLWRIVGLEIASCILDNNSQLFKNLRKKLSN